MQVGGLYVLKMIQMRTTKLFRIYAIVTLYLNCLQKKRNIGFIPDDDLSVATMNGMIDGYLYHEDSNKASDEFKLCKESLAVRKKKSFENKRGRSSDGLMPFFDLNCNGKGAIIAIGWSGTWKAEFTASDEGANVKTGIKNTLNLFFS